MSHRQSSALQLRALALNWAVVWRHPPVGAHRQLACELKAHNRSLGAREQLVRLYRWRPAFNFRNRRPSPRRRRPPISPAPPSELAVPCCGDGPRAIEFQVACRGGSGFIARIPRSSRYGPICGGPRRERPAGPGAAGPPRRYVSLDGNNKVGRGASVAFLRPAAGAVRMDPKGAPSRGLAKPASGG